MLICSRGMPCRFHVRLGAYSSCLCHHMVSWFVFQAVLLVTVLFTCFSWLQITFIAD